VRKKAAAKQRKKSVRPEKRVDETSHLTGKRRGATLRAEVWYSGGVVVKYNLAYINPRICGVDHGRVLGYDNSHGSHHRHFMGKIEKIEFAGYEMLVDRFEAEVHALWRSEDEQES